MEQPELGNVGLDTITVMLTWSWDRGWRCRLSSQPLVSLLPEHRRS